MNEAPSRRQWLASATAVSLSLVWPGARSQTWPDSVRVLCGYPPGGSVDTVSRRLADQLVRRLARTSIVENRVGAAGRLAVDVLKNAPSDGSTLLVTPASVLTMYPHIYRPLGYDVFADLAPVAMLASTEFCLAIGSSVPPHVQTFDDFIGWCKANPAHASCGNAGAGSFPHFMALLLAREAALELTHVPYRGGSAAMLALTGGQVSAALATEGSALALEQAGKLRVLATSGAQQSNFFAKAPTFAALGLKALTHREWFAVVAPGRTPARVVQGVADTANAMLGEPEVRDAWARLGLLTTGSTPSELASALRAEHDFWGPIIKASGFTPEA